MFTLTLTLLAGSAALAQTTTAEAPPATVAVAATHAMPAKTLATVGSPLPAGPNLPGAITPQQLADAYDRWALQRLHVDSAIVHTP